MLEQTSCVMLPPRKLDWTELKKRMHFHGQIKENIKGHRGQRSRSLCNFIGKKKTFFSTINELLVLN